MAEARPYAAVALAVVAVSFASPLFLLAASPPLVKAFYRLALASLLLLPIVLGHSPAALGQLRGRDGALVVLTGVVLAGHFATWVTSLDLTSVAASTLLVTIHPILVATVSHVYLRDRVGRTAAVGTALGLGGAAAITAGDYGLGGGANPLLGDLLAFVGGVLSGLYLLLGRRLRQRIDLLPYALGVYGTAALVLLAATFALGSGPLPSPGGHGLAAELLLFLALAVVSSLGGHTLYNWALRRVTATVVSVSLVGEPLGASLLTLLLVGQAPPLHVLAGAPPILLGIYLVARPSPPLPPAAAGQPS